MSEERSLKTNMIKGDNMAQNDMEIIVYKILNYLYECMKAGKHPRLEDMGSTCQMFRIPQEYWNQVMEELIDCGYVKGF